MMSLAGTFRKNFAPRAGLIAVLSMALGACSADHVSSEAAELSNTWAFLEVPKSSPTQLVASFARYCANKPDTVETADAALRAAGYVPVSNQRAARAYVVDYNRPAIALSDRMCLVRAKSRTGQTDAFQNYITRAFPAAQPIDPAPLGRRIEQAWRVPGPSPRIIATERGADLGWYTYSLILFQVEAA
ncbi:MAG: hypothetical protein AB3N11_09155 [Arenibacterium sp.]